jgi:hypothetical protein
MTPPSYIYTDMATPTPTPTHTPYPAYTYIHTHTWVTPPPPLHTPRKLLNQHQVVLCRLVGRCQEEDARSGYALYVCMYICMYVYMYVYMCVWFWYVCMYVYICVCVFLGGGRVLDGWVWVLGGWVLGEWVDVVGVSKVKQTNTKKNKKAPPGGKRTESKK